MTAPLRKNGILVTTIARGCESKNRYPDVHVARAMAQTKERLSGIPMYFYPCKICRGYHLTKHEQRDKSRAAAYVFTPTPR